LNDRRANLSRNILALSAMFGGVPIVPGYPPAPARIEPHPEAKAIALDLGVTYSEAERAYLRLGAERARDLLTICKSRNLILSSDLLDAAVRFEPPSPSMFELSEAFQKAKVDPTSLLRPAVPEVRQQRRSLVERKARRAKRKQRRNR